jgi:ERCC4-type nuclease
MVTEIRVSESLDIKYREALERNSVKCVVIPSPFTDIEMDKTLILIRDADDVALLDQAVLKAKSLNKRFMLIFVGTEHMKSSINWIGKAMRRVQGNTVAVLPAGLIPDFVKMIAETENGSAFIPIEDERMMVSCLTANLKVNMSIARQLRAKFKTADDLRNATEKDFHTLVGITPETIKSIMESAGKWLKK